MPDTGLASPLLFTRHADSNRGLPEILKRKLVGTSDQDAVVRPRHSTVSCGFVFSSWQSHEHR